MYGLRRVRWPDEVREVGDALLLPREHQFAEFFHKKSKFLEVQDCLEFFLLLFLFFGLHFLFLLLFLVGNHFLLDLSF